ncbi:MAG: aminopeptidase, partial [Bacteroides sp.]
MAYAQKTDLHLCQSTPIEKGLQSINRQTAEAQVNFLACDDMEGREAGFQGSRLAARYISSLLQMWGIQPVGNSYLQPFEAYRKERQQRGRFQ